jgi:hypothetical protein
MKKFVLIAGLIITGLLADAQSGSWKIKINNKTILSTGTEDEKANCKKMRLSEWSKPGVISISFKENEPGMWIRSFLFYDKEDHELLRKDSVIRVKIAFSELKKIFKDKKEIVIYTVIAPSDPRMAIRVRRVHLCTLKLP